MKDEALDKLYGERLEELYQIAVKKEEPHVGLIILDKIRSFKLYLIKPDEDESV
jgi:hypothetical protein